jgi:hypothetical protein
MQTMTLDFVHVTALLMLRQLKALEELPKQVVRVDISGRRVCPVSSLLPAWP